MRCRLLALLLLGPTILASGSPAWRQVYDRLRTQRDHLVEDLAQAHAVLLSRARLEQPALVPQLTEPPASRLHGYGIVPELREDRPEAPVTALERSYSLTRLADDLENDLHDSANLVVAAAGLPLDVQVAELERLRARLSNVEEHLDYHAYWQRAVVEQSDFFAARNRLLAEMRELNANRQSGAPPEQIAERSRALLEHLAPFTPTPGLRIETRDGGQQVLPVVLYTDIENDAFLSVFQHAVETLFERAPSASAPRFAIELEIRKISPSTLYPEGAPARGAAIEMSAHLARFPAGALVLTTGADSTNAWTSQYIALGPDPVTRRTLAHEFAHLLGFRDAYLRGYDGDPRDAYGAILVEWIGLANDLMGDSEHGRVTEAMIRTLLQAYGQRQDPPSEAAGEVPVRRGNARRRRSSRGSRAAERPPVGVPETTPAIVGGIRRTSKS